MNIGDVLYYSTKRLIISFFKIDNDTVNLRIYQKQIYSDDWITILDITKSYSENYNNRLFLKEIRKNSTNPLLHKK